MITKSKSTLAQELVGPLLTRDDLAALLLAYYGAVALDADRVDELRKKGNLPRSYNRKEWQEHRKDHFVQLERLLDTLSYVSQEILVSLTILAATRKSSVVRKAFTELLTRGSLAYWADERMYDAPEFFTALLKEAGGSRPPKDGKGTIERMMGWLEPVDPLQIARNGGYKNIMPLQVWS